MSQIRVSAQLQPQHSDWSAMRQAWVEAEELGVDCLFNWDHFFPLRGEPDGKHFEALTVLGAMAEVTERVELGSLVICNAYRNPELPRRRAPHDRPHLRRPRDPRHRRRLVRAGLRRVRLRVRHGRHAACARCEEAMPRIEARLGKLNPPPARQPIPILIGGGGPKVTLKLVAQYGNIWHSFGDPDVVREKNEILLEHCADVGRDPAEIERTWGVAERRLGRRSLRRRRARTSSSASRQRRPATTSGALRELVQWRDAR